MYQWILAFHIIAVIAWMAGMLYLPRLFVYHCAAERGSVQSETFKVMERRLLRGIINPAMIISIALGLRLGWLGPDSHFGWFAAGWLQAKIVLVMAMAAVHGFLVRWVQAFDRDQNQHSAKFYRTINEIPAVLMVAIVLLVVLKPF